jgi:hypothetical protein
MKPIAFVQTFLASFLVNDFKIINMKIILISIILFSISSCVKRETATKTRTNTSSESGSNNTITEPVVQKTILRLINCGNKCTFVMGRSWSNYYEVAPQSQRDVEICAGNFEYSTICSFSASCNYGSGSCSFQTINIVPNSITELNVSCN